MSLVEALPIKAGKESKCPKLPIGVLALNYHVDIPASSGV